MLRASSEVTGLGLGPAKVAPIGSLASCVAKGGEREAVALGLSCT